MTWQSMLKYCASLALTLFEPTYSIETGDHLVVPLRAGYIKSMIEYEFASSFSPLCHRHTGVESFLVLRRIEIEQLYCT